VATILINVLEINWPNWHI